MISADALIQNLTSAPLLFFTLGLVATAVRSDLTIPEQVGRFLSLYLIVAIGFKGGVALRAEGWSVELAATLAIGVALGLVIPLVAFAVLRRISRVGPLDAASIAGHYGSVSLVTFLACLAFLERVDVEVEGFMVAVLAVMESPGILMGILLARRADRTRVVALGGALREAATNGSFVLLVGATVAGLVAGARGMADLEGFLVAPFAGLLALFLLDMGLVAGARLRDFRTAGWGLVAFGLVMPLVGGTLGLLGGALVGLSLGGTTALALLGASASYIAAPAAMRLAIPEANPSLSLGLALGVTFPFNVVVGIPLFFGLAHVVT